MGCTTLDLAHFLGRKWTIVLLEEIHLKKFAGFNQVLEKSGMTPKTLSAELKGMVSLGLAHKTGHEKTIYQLTEKGDEFRKIILEIKKFNIKWGNMEADCLERSCLECGKFLKDGIHIIQNGQRKIELK